MRVLGSDGGSLWIRISQATMLCIYHRPGPLRLSSSQGWAGHLPLSTPHLAQVAQHTQGPALPQHQGHGHSSSLTGLAALGRQLLKFDSNFKIALSTFKIVYPLHTGTRTIWPPVCQMILNSSRVYFYSFSQAPK